MLVLDGPARDIVRDGVDMARVDAWPRLAVVNAVGRDGHDLLDGNALAGVPAVVRADRDGVLSAPDLLGLAIRAAQPVVEEEEGRGAHPARGKNAVGGVYELSHKINFGKDGGVGAGRAVPRPRDDIAEGLDAETRDVEGDKIGAATLFAHVHGGPPAAFAPLFLCLCNAFGEACAEERFWGGEYVFLHEPRALCLAGAGPHFVRHGPARYCDNGLIPNLNLILCPGLVFDAGADELDRASLDAHHGAGGHGGAAAVDAQHAGRDGWARDAVGAHDSVAAVDHLCLKSLPECSVLGWVFCLVK